MVEVLKSKELSLTAAVPKTRKNILFRKANKSSRRSDKRIRIPKLKEIQSYHSLNSTQKKILEPGNKFKKLRKLILAFK